MKKTHAPKENSIDRKTFLRRFLIYALAILFFISVILAYYSMLYSETRQRIIKSGELNSATSAEQIDKYLSKGIDTIELVCFTLDNMIRAGKTLDDIHDFLVNQSSAVLHTMEDNTTGLYGYVYGEYVDGTDWVPDDDYVPTSRPWYIDAIANRASVAVVDPYVDEETHTVTITFAKTLCDGKSVAAMDFLLNTLQKVTEAIAAEGESDFEILLDRKYNVIAHSDEAEVGRSYIAESGTFGSELCQKLRSTGDEGFFSLSYNGAEYIVYAVKVSNDWICLSVYNATSVFSQLKNSLAFTIIVLLAVVIIFAAIIIGSNKKREQFSKMRNMVKALAAVIDAKDAYTNGHSGRVAEYAKEIGRRSGFSEKQQEEIYLMGLLHDVGKIDIPDAVINKPGKLTPEEFDVIKKHPVIGAQILSKMTDMPRMAIGACWHHERYDGKGYPDGLSGQEIPAEARIIAVADAYDAMTSRRSYRDILPQDKVRNEIKNGKGTQFDPAFADIMIKMIDEDKNFSLHGT